MASSKKGRDAGNRRKKDERKLRKCERQKGTVARFSQTDIHAEIGHITRLAQAGDSRIVTIGPLLLFSTRSRDAWLFDREDNFAICVRRDGEPQPFRVVDTAEQFGIEWTADFAIDGDTFVVH
jgi:hypothetical protein